MDSPTSEWHNAAAAETERPSESFIRAVADFLETDAEDILAELGYVYDEAVVYAAAPAPVASA